MSTQNTKRHGVEVNKSDKEHILKRIFCGYNPVGDLAEFINRGAEIDIDVEPGEKSVRTLCWCCTFWRGVLFGAIIGLLVGSWL